MKCFQLIVIFGLFAERKAECPLSPEYFQETKPVQAVSGKNIVLPCFPKFNLSVGHHILEWHFYEKEIYTFEKKGLVQEEKYNNRLFTSTEELEKGNASIQLCDVKESDAGEYCCCIVTTPVPLPKCTKMNLVVDEGSPDNSPRVNESTHFTDTTITDKPTEPDKMNWMKYVKEIIIIVVVVVVVIVVVIVIVIICFMVLIYNVITIIIKCFLFQRQGKISCRGQERGQPNSPNIESIEEEQMELIEKNKR